MLPLAALVGGFVGGPLLEVLGRKTTIMTTAIPFMGAGPIFLAIYLNKYCNVSSVVEF